MALPVPEKIDRGTGGLVRGMGLIVLTGLALGIGFNWLGLRSNPSFGLSWIAEDRLAGMATLDELATGGHAVSDDPMAVVGGAGAAADLPQIPALDRPIQIELAAAHQLFAAGAAMFVDARELSEYAAGHIPGALSLPYDVVSSEPERLEALAPGGKPIIIYCGGGACELSLNMAWDMIYAGQTRIAVYMGGYPEWEEAGHPIEQGTDGGEL